MERVCAVKLKAARADAEERFDVVRYVKALALMVAR
jgi:hypothetical protein